MHAQEACYFIDTKRKINILGPADFLDHPV